MPKVKGNDSSQGQPEKFSFDWFAKGYARRLLRSAGLNGEELRTVIRAASVDDLPERSKSRWYREVIDAALMLNIDGFLSSYSEAVQSSVYTTVRHFYGNDSEEVQTRAAYAEILCHYTKNEIVSESKELVKALDLPNSDLSEFEASQDLVSWVSSGGAYRAFRTKRICDRKFSILLAEVAGFVGNLPSVSGNEGIASKLKRLEQSDGNIESELEIISEIFAIMDRNFRGVNAMTVAICSNSGITEEVKALFDAEDVRESTQDDRLDLERLLARKPKALKDLEAKQHNYPNIQLLGSNSKIAEKSLERLYACLKDNRTNEIPEARDDVRDWLRNALATAISEDGNGGAGLIIDITCDSKDPIMRQMAKIIADVVDEVGKSVDFKGKVKLNGQLVNSKNPENTMPIRTQPPFPSHLSPKV